MFKKIVQLILILTISVSVYEIFNLKYFPCDHPISYKIGIIDPKFNLKDKEVLKYSDEAAGILSTAYGKELFKYSQENPVLTINFIYDERSELNSRINKESLNIDAENATLKEKVNQFNSDAKDFEKKLNDFNTTVQMYNSHGGAPAGVYEDLIRQQEELKKEADSLDKRAKELNLAANNFNSQVDNLNRNVDQFNKALTVKPEEGLYDPNDNSITIYFVNNKDELIHTIAHELGHSIGMGHVENNNAIMYPMTSKTLGFTQEDGAELDKACSPVAATKYWSLLLQEKLRNQPAVMVK